MNAAAIALGMHAEVLLLDKDINKLRAADRIYQGHLQTIASNAYEIERACLDADLVIGAVLVPGAKAPMLISNDLVSRMKPGSVLVDISIDQGGCFEDSRATTHADPTYKVHESIFYCVANMPGAVPHTSTYALTNVTLPYAVALANKGWQRACQDDRSLALGPQHPRRPPHQRPRGRGGGHRCRGSGYRPRVTDTAALTRAIRTYLDHLAVERGLAANTLSSYRRDLRRYADHLAQEGVSTLDEVTEAIVSGFLMRLREGDADHPPLSSTSAARTVVAVRGFHKFAVADGLATLDPAERGQASDAGEAVAEGAAPVRRRGDPRGGRRAGHHARAARPRVAGGALRHRCPHLRGGRPRHRRHRHRRRHRAAARQGLQGAARADRRLCPRRGRGLPHPGPAHDRRGVDARRSDVPQLPRRPALSAERLGGAGEGGRASRCHPRRLAAHAAPLVRDPPARRWRRRPRRPGAPRARVRHHDAGLHPGHRRQPARGLRHRAPRARD